MNIQIKQIKQMLYVIWGAINFILIGIIDELPNIWLMGLLIGFSLGYWLVVLAKKIIN